MGEIVSGAEFRQNATPLKLPLTHPRPDHRAFPPGHPQHDHCQRQRRKQRGNPAQVGALPFCSTSPPMNEPPAIPR